MRTKGKLGAFLAGSGAGAAFGYAFDPQMGRRRRHMLRDRLAAKTRRGSHEIGRKARYMAGKAQGVVAEATPPGRGSSDLNDSGLAAKVETELFRPKGAPKGKVDVSVEGGVVYLRGEAESREQIEDLVERAQSIDGVGRVRPSEMAEIGHTPAAAVRSVSGPPRRVPLHRPLYRKEFMGILDKITGKAKQAAGDIADDASLRRQGKREEAKGEKKEELDRAQERADEKAEEVADLERKT